MFLVQLAEADIGENLFYVFKLFPGLKAERSGGTGERSVINTQAGLGGSGLPMEAPLGDIN